MKIGMIAAIALTLIGLCAVMFAFVQGASPYVTVAQAKTMDGDNLHLSGDIDTRSLNSTGRIITFNITDEMGDKATIIYDGPPPANMGDATKVVAVGRMNGENFEAHKLILKCPSKYESEAENE